MATGVAVQSAVKENQMNKVTRASTGETSWAARYWGENSSIVVDLRKLDSKLKNKTRSQVFTDGCEEHDAFRVILLWLWRKWVMHNATGKHVAISDIPPQVKFFWTLSPTAS
jgi:hypothetical protein